MYQLETGFIETVWAKLRMDLALREFEELRTGKDLHDCFHAKGGAALDLLFHPRPR